MKIKITVDDTGIRNTLGALERDANKVLALALNKTMGNVKTQALKDVSQVSSAKQKYVRRVTKQTSATPSRLIAQLSMSGRRLPVTAFSARQTKRGITFRGRNGVRQLIRSAFLQTAPSKGGFYAAWMRKFNRTKAAQGTDFRGRARMNRLPLRKLKAISVGHIFLSKPVLDPLNVLINQRWGVNVKQSLDMYFNGKK